MNSEKLKIVTTILVVILVFMGLTLFSCCTAAYGEYQQTLEQQQTIKKTQEVKEYKAKVLKSFNKNYKTYNYCFLNKDKKKLIKYKSIIKKSNTKTTIKKYYNKSKKIFSKAKKIKSTYKYSSSYFKSAGVVYYHGWRWTWYSQKVLPGGGLKIPGRHVDKRGYVCDKNNYICLASSTLSRGTIVKTPFGKKGKIYDSGCAYNTIDVYVNF